jgi:hypothetical protein
LVKEAGASIGPRDEPRRHPDLGRRWAEHRLGPAAAMHVEAERHLRRRRAFEVTQHERNLRVLKACAHVA